MAKKKRSLKVIPAPKKAQLKLEHPSRLKAKAIKASWDNDMIHDNPYTTTTAKQFMDKRKVDSAFKLGKKKK
jgi:hypothetical protein